MRGTFFDFLKSLGRPKKITAVNSFKTRGIFEVRGYDQNGKQVYHDVDNNLIVDLGYDTMLLRLATVAVDRHITQIGFGIGTGAAAPGDTTLTGGFIKVLDGVIYPAFNKVQFQWALEYGEFNGNDVTEFSLFCEDGVNMFSRVVRAPISKNATIRLEGTWTIIF